MGCGARARNSHPYLSREPEIKEGISQRGPSAFWGGDGVWGPDTGDQAEGGTEERRGQQAPNGGPCEVRGSRREPHPDPGLRHREAGTGAESQEDEGRVSGPEPAEAPRQRILCVSRRLHVKPRSRLAASGLGKLCLRLPSRAAVTAAKC